MSVENGSGPEGMNFVAPTTRTESAQPTPAIQSEQPKAEAPQNPAGDVEATKAEAADFAPKAPGVLPEFANMSPTEKAQARFDTHASNALAKKEGAIKATNESVDTRIAQAKARATSEPMMAASLGMVIGSLESTRQDEHRAAEQEFDKDLTEARNNFFKESQPAPVTQPQPEVAAPMAPQQPEAPVAQPLQPESKPTPPAPAAAPKPAAPVSNSFLSRVGRFLGFGRR